MARRRRGRPVNGVLVLDKSAGPSSNQALQRIRYLFGAAKGGHTGSLDPDATGVLPLCFGEATKFAAFLLDADKVYRSTFILGATTDTADAQGNVLTETDASHLVQADIEAVLDRFRGDFEQIPPMVSALKQGGKPLYELARQGIEVDRPPRPVTVHSLELEAFETGKQALLTVTVHCSKGFYVRSLAQDIGEALGVGGHVSALRRLRTGRFTIEQALTQAELEQFKETGGLEALDARLLPVEALLGDFSALQLESSSSHYFMQGQAVTARVGEPGTQVKVYGPGERFLGLGEATDDGRVQPRRLVAQ